MGKLCFHILFLILTNSFLAGVHSSSTFTLVNKCDFIVWPGILSNARITSLSPIGFALQIGELRVINAPSSWGGQFWGRTHCHVDSTGKFSRVTGDCGSEKVECDWSGAAPPTTLAKLTLDSHSGMNFYNVSLVSGYNLLMRVVPQPESMVNYTRTRCLDDLYGSYPSEMCITSNDLLMCILLL